MMSNYKNLVAWWFPEWNLTEQKIENVAKNTIATSFEGHWFANIETPAVERNIVLLAKSGEDVSKQVYGLYGLAQWSTDTKDYSLRFDLTVPLARYVIDHEQELPFPFKRYQIQKVWRWESHQKWRFKEFYQCDVDVIGNNLDVGYDADVIITLMKTLEALFTKLWINQKLQVQVNNRKIYDTIFDLLKLDENKRKKILILIDNYYKIWENKFQQDLSALLWKDQSKKLLSLLNINREDNQIKELQWPIAELNSVLKSLQASWIEVVYDPYIVRWLDYYSWTVFETYFRDYQEFGSICSGWRFDNLVSYIREAADKKWQNYQWVWWSIGLTRLLHRLIEKKLITESFSLADVMVFNFNDWLESSRSEIANNLRQSWIRVDQFHGKWDLRQQFKYAENKKIPIWIFYSQQEKDQWIVKIRDLETKTDAICKVEWIADQIESILKWKNNKI